MVSNNYAEQKKASVIGKESGQTEQEVEKGKAVIALEYANALMNEGREEDNPLKIGLAAVSFYAMKFDKDKKYATNLLQEATKLAKTNKDVYTMKWLADVWGDATLGAGDEETAKKLLKEADDLEKTLSLTPGLTGADAPKASFLLPKEFMEE
jgi:hypothetical protein